MELGLNSYMLTLKVTQISIITVAIVLVLLPKITILSVLNNLFSFSLTNYEYCVFLWYLERKSTVILILITMKCKFILTRPIWIFYTF
jgi:hypothetical protein